MKIQKKQMAAAIAMALMLTTMFALPVAFGQQFTRESLTWVSVYPNPIGKGQNVFIVGWVYPMPSPQGALYLNLTFTVTKPDGTKFTRTMDSSVEGTLGFNYVPDQAGNWSVVLNFPGDYVRFYVSGSVSPPYKFTVQEDPIPFADYSALPLGRWTWPITLANQEWYRITGSWPKNYGDGYGSTNYYSPGPESAHILWKKPFMNGGLFGGSQGHEGIVRPDQGAQFPGNPVAARGRLYYKSERIRVATGSGAIPTDNVTAQDRVPIIVCIDQYSGEKLWETELPTINYTTGRSVAAARNGGSTLQIVELSIAKGVSSKGVSLPGMGNSGDFALWASGGGLWKIDPLTGQIIWYQLEPALSPTYFDGAWYIANYPVTGNYSMLTANSDYNNGFPPMADASFGFPQTVQDVIIWTKNMSTSGIPSGPAIVEGYLVQLQSNSVGEAKLNTWDAKTGNLIANGTYGGYWASSASNPVYGSGVYSRLGGDGKTYAWSFKTGSIAWVSEADTAEYPWSTFGNYQGTAGFGYIIAASYAPYKYCINAATGEIVWKQYTGTDNPYNYEYPTHAPATWGLAILADNKVYWTSGEHTPGTPSERGDMMYCNDLTTGELLWRLPYVKGGRQFYGSGIADGMLFYFNQYDGCLYMIGKGETKTTVSTQQNVASGNAALIQGRVTDISPGTSTLPNFPDGVPAVGDEGMSDWMAYLYTLGTTGPLVDLTKVMGVPVTIDVLDANGNYRNIGTTTSDASGFFSFEWEPDISGKYTVIATFAGSKSYYTSSSETAFVVGEAPTPVETPVQPVDNTDTYIMYAAIAIIVAVAIVGALLAMLLIRKRP